MKGHIRERSPGHWAIILDIPDPKTGKRRRKWHSFKGTKRQAQIESARLISEFKSGNAIEPSRTTVGEYLDNGWSTSNRRSVRAQQNATANSHEKTYRP
jgi:hypothetical protein